VTPLGWTIVAMAAVTFGPRAWGLFLPATRLHGYGRRLVDLVPVAVFAALAATGLPGADLADGTWRLASAALTGVVVARTRALGPGLLAGLAAYLAVRALGGA